MNKLVSVRTLTFVYWNGEKVPALVTEVTNNGFRLPNAEDNIGPLSFHNTDLAITE